MFILLLIFYMATKQGWQWSSDAQRKDERESRGWGENFQEIDYELSIMKQIITWG